MHAPGTNDDDDNPPRASLIIPAAGESSRMGLCKRKPWLDLAGRPVIMHTLAAFAKLDWIEEVILVVNPEDEDEARERMWEELNGLGVSIITTGGGSRAESVWKGLQLTNPRLEVVAVHDAVRPFFSIDTCRALLRTARDRGAAVPAIPVSDTIKRVEGDKILQTVARTGLMAVQTPQCFRRELLIDAFELAFSTGGLSQSVTDEAWLVEQYGQEVTVILGSANNIKLTTREDMVLATALLRSGLLVR